MKTFTIEAINEVLQGILVGNTNTTIIGPEQLEMAQSNHISFIGNKKY